MVVGGSHPQAENIRAVLADDLFGGNGVAQGFVHGLAFPVYYPAVGADSLIRCLAGSGNSG